MEAVPEGDMLPPGPADAVIVKMRVNPAWTSLASFIETVHAPVPEQAPDHPLNIEFASAVALRLTEIPSMKACEHEVPQLMPAGELVAVPLPDPVLLTLRT